MGRTCGKHDRGEKCVQYFCLKCLMEISHLLDFDVDGKNFKMDLQVIMRCTGCVLGVY
jgi:hypothetical protein